MRLAIEIVWWIGLLGALPATLVIVKEALLVIDRLRRIHKLAEITNLAAHGISVHLAPAGGLAAAPDLVKKMDDAVREFATAIEAVNARNERPEFLTRGELFT